MNPVSVTRHLNQALNELRLARDSVDPMSNDCYEEITDAIECVKAASIWLQTDRKEGLQPIHKFNGGNGATLCNECRVVITEGFTDDLYCRTCKPEE